MISRKIKTQGSVTIFLALCLSFLIIFILTLTQLCIYLSNRVRLEGIYDMSMNSALGEYSIALKDIYDLLYVDTSYITGQPSKEKLRNQVSGYIYQNQDKYNSISGPWGKIEITSVELMDMQTATAEHGASMRRQAVAYMNDIGEIKKANMIEIGEVLDSGDLNILENAEDILGEWQALMESIEAMPLPKKKNKKTGKLEEVSLTNPVDWVFALSGSDILYLSEVNCRDISGISVNRSSLCSSTAVNLGAMEDIDHESDMEFASYLMEKMSCYQKKIEGRVLRCELEYIISQKDSDYQNFREVVDRIYRARLQDNYRIACEDGGLYAEALAQTSLIEVCTLAPEFIEPIACSFIYACAFLETISDMHCLLSGGRVPLEKSGHSMSIGSILSGGKYFSSPGQGLDYRQYLLGMILIMEEDKVNMGALDLMELNVRDTGGDMEFSMDWCVEKFRVALGAAPSGPFNMNIDRIYGIY